MGTFEPYAEGNYQSAAQVAKSAHDLYVQPVSGAKGEMMPGGSMPTAGNMAGAKSGKSGMMPSGSMPTAGNMAGAKSGMMPSGSMPSAGNMAGAKSGMMPSGSMPAAGNTAGVQSGMMPGNSMPAAGNMAGMQSGMMPGSSMPAAGNMAGVQSGMMPCRMGISTRNLLRGRVVSITPGAVNSIVLVTLSGGQTITASVTMDAVRDMGLRIGSPVTVVINPNDVLLIG